MKIGILTLPLHTNYGGILQAWALQTVLERMGHEAFVIKNDFPLPIWRRAQKHFKELILKQDTDLTLLVNPNKIIKFISAMHSKQCDAIIVGSDQVWRYIYIKSIIGKYFLDGYGKDVIRLSYAASFGIDTWDYPEIDTVRCSELIKQFKAVSVREKSGVELCKKYLGIEATHVLDPTQLLSKQDYLTGLNTTPVSHPFSTFILDPTEYKKDVVSRLEQLESATAFSLNKPIGEKLSVEEFIQHFAGTELLITDSFHGTAFAINFNIPFVVLGNPNRGQTRLLSILETFGLQNRLLSNPNDIKKLIAEKIDWKSVNEIMNDRRKDSLAFLNIITQ